MRIYTATRIKNIAPVTGKMLVRIEAEDLVCTHADPADDGTAVLLVASVGEGNIVKSIEEIWLHGLKETQDNSLITRQYKRCFDSQDDSTNNG